MKIYCMRRNGIQLVSFDNYMWSSLVYVMIWFLFFLIITKHVIAFVSAANSLATLSPCWQRDKKGDLYTISYPPILTLSIIPSFVADQMLWPFLPLYSHSLWSTQMFRAHPAFFSPMDLLRISPCLSVNYQYKEHFLLTTPSGHTWQGLRNIPYQEIQRLQNILRMLKDNRNHQL